MKTASLLGALLLCAACPASALAKSADDLKNDQQTSGDVLVYGMGYSGQRYSPLTRIDKSNIGQLVPKWAYSINDSRGAEAFPVVKDGVIYTTAHNMTAAVDALTGKQLWRTAHDYPPETLRVVCCGIVNRGVAPWPSKVDLTIGPQPPPPIASRKPPPRPSGTIQPGGSAPTRSLRNAFQRIHAPINRR